ncbi:MAG: hypothetical protein WC455_25325 [Dehalococcoidia bacterium]|jgi:hypothetical protein
MANLVYANGTKEIAIPAGEKIAMYSRSTARLYQKVGYPNFPETWNFLYEVVGGTEYLTAAFTDASTVRIDAGPADCQYEVGAAPSIFEPQGNISLTEVAATVNGLAAAQGGSVTVKGGTSSTAGNAGGAAAILGGQPGATGVGGAATVTGGAGGATSGAGGAARLTGGAGTNGNANGGSAVVTGGAKNGSGIDGHSKIKKLVVVDQGAPTAKTTAATLTIAELLTGILTGTHAAGATQAYTLPTGALVDAAVQLDAGEAFDWYLINLSAAAADTITVTAGDGHTIVGNPIVQSADSTTGGIYGNSSKWRTRKTAANTYVTYRLA